MPSQHNFGIEANGEYKITLTINEEEGNKIASEKVGDVAALPVPVESVELNKTSIVLVKNLDVAGRALAVAFDGDVRLAFGDCGNETLA